jgi:hypothetical protein
MQFASFQIITGAMTLGHTNEHADLCGKQGKIVIVTANSVNSG